MKRVWLASRERLPFWTPGSVPLFGTCLFSIYSDQIYRNCRIFSRLFTLNTPRYSLDFAFNIYVNGRSAKVEKIRQRQLTVGRCGCQFLLIFGSADDFVDPPKSKYSLTGPTIFPGFFYRLLKEIFITMSAEGHLVIGRQPTDGQSMTCYQWIRMQIAAWYRLSSTDDRPTWLLLYCLCLAHIKIYDRSIKILSVGRQIYQDWLSQIGRRRAFTLKYAQLITNGNSSVLHRSIVGRSTPDNRTTVGRSSADDWTTGHLQIHIGTCVIHNYVGI